MRVLIGTDGSDDAITAATRSLTILAAPDVVTVVCVTETPILETAGMESGFGGGIATPEQIEAERAASHEAAAAALERTVAALSTSANVEPRIEMGEAGATLCDLAAELGADVVVVGSRGRGAIRRALMGSVSTHVVNHAPCPVIVIRVSA